MSIEEGLVERIEQQAKRIAELEQAICAWAKEHGWAVKEWKAEPENKALFDIAADVWLKRNL